MRNRKTLDRIQQVRIGATVIPVVDDCGQYRSVEGPTVFTGPPALQPGTTEYATTIFHELLHAVSDLYGLGLKERQVRVLEQTIAAQFAQNPEWAKLYFDSILTPIPRQSEESCPKAKPRKRKRRRK